MIGNIASIDTMGLVDGPGIRVVVFLKGCPLRCKFCHNPEMFSNDIKEKWLPEDLINYILKFKGYFKENGGVTFSGGEPLNQSKFLLECLKLCKRNGIHTALDTSGVGSDYEEILDYVDLVIWDLKEIDKDKYKELTSFNIKPSLDFLKMCQKKKKKLWIRQVIIPGYNDNISYMLEIKDFVKKLKNVEKVELLPYHTMGINKYKELGIPYRLDGVSDMDREKCKELEKIITGL